MMTPSTASRGGIESPWVRELGFGCQPRLIFLACVLFFGIAVLSEDRFVIIRVCLWAANAIAAPLAWLY